MDDPLNVAGELSEAELACASGVADPGRLLQIFSAPEQADTDELSQLINCMEDETVLRLFITDLVGLEEPLSEEASACVRSGMEGVDARSVILSGMAGDAAAAMTGSMTSFLLVLTCLDDDEFAAAAPALGVPVDEREGMLCLLGEIGGPEKFAAAFSGQDGEAMLALLGAAITCGVEMEGAPGMTDGSAGQTPPPPGPWGGDRRSRHDGGQSLAHILAVVPCGAVVPGPVGHHPRNDAGPLGAGIGVAGTAGTGPGLF